MSHIHTCCVFSGWCSRYVCVTYIRIGCSLAASSRATRIWMSRVTHMNESCHTCEWGIPQMWMRRVTHVKDWFHSHIPDKSFLCVEWIVHSVWNESYRHTYIHTYIHTCTVSRASNESVTVCGMNCPQCVEWVIQTDIHTYMHTYMHTHIHTYIHPSIHPSIHTYIHTYIHPSIHAYIHTYIPAQSLVRRTNHPHTHTWRVSSFHTHLPQEPLQGDAVAALISLLAALTTHEVNDLSMTHSTENATTPKSTKSRNSKSLVQIQIQPTSDFGFVPRGTEQSEFLDLVDFCSVAISVETVILVSLLISLLRSLAVIDHSTHIRVCRLISAYQRDMSRESPWLIYSYE